MPGHLFRVTTGDERSDRDQGAVSR